jgi:Thermopsin
MTRFGSVQLSAILITALMMGLALVAITTAPVAAAGASPAVVPSPAAPVTPSTASSVAAPSVETPTPAICNQLQTESNDPQYAQFVNHVGSIARGAAAAGLPNAGEHLPYAGPIPDQTVNGVAMAGSELSAECEQGLQATSQTDPSGVAYNGQSDVAGVVDKKLDSNSVAGVLTVNSQTQNFYPGSGTPTQWGAQENVVLPNVTILGSHCPTASCKSSAVSSGNYAFWVQNVISYDSFNDTISFVDDTWNFTSGASDMFSSSLAGWSPNGGNYTGVWVAFSPYYYAPPPFTVTAYVNTSVNAAGDQILWYNYSLDDYATHTFIGNGNYDYLIFNSQPAVGGPVAVAPPDFEASAVTHHEVTEGYEFDAFIGADDGSNNLMLGENATMQVQYCNAVPYCTPTSFSYANVPAAVDIGSQTGEQSNGIGESFVGATAYMSPGPLISHGLWNYSGQVGVEANYTAVTNGISVSGDPEGALATQPYVFVFMENTAYTSQGFQWVPDQPTWYLMPGTYNYQIMLADYLQINGTLTVGAAPTVLSAVLPYTPAMGVYTPLWAFGNGELAGISTSGNGTLANQYVPFNNPTTTYFGFTPNNLSANFYSSDDYHFPTFTGMLLDGTNAYVDVNSPVSFCVHSAVSRGVTTYYYLGLEFFNTSHVTLANDHAIRGWPNWEEISFYISVPASQNPAPQAEVFVWNSTGDLIMSNTFIGTPPGSGYVAPDELVMYGGSNNVVWGNTFEDPIHTAMGTTYAGLGLADEHDLIYNNNFSVDNPVVYLPYNWDNVADCLPQSLGGCGQNQAGNGFFYNDPANVVGNTWNVTPQAASNVVNTINGFPLSGNVLGPSVTTQGGNYYWNLGTSPNNRSTVPYVSRFYYSDWSNIFPLGCGSIQAPGAPCGTAPTIVGAYENGIQVGGDYAAYGPTVTFTETGLVSGTSWTVVVGGSPYATSGTSISVPEAYGTYAYSVTPVPGYTQSVTSGSVFVSGVPTIAVTFTQVTYLVKFTESGLPAATSWSVTINSATQTTSGTSMTFDEPNGTYGYTISTAVGGTFAGSTTVNGTPVTVATAFHKVTFVETGLPSGTSWQVTANSLTLSSITNKIVYYLDDGTYAYEVGLISGYHTSDSGSFTVVGTALSVAVPFKQTTYTVKFTETGFTSAWKTEWCVTFNSVNKCVTGATSIAFTGIPNGTYGYTIGNVANYSLNGGMYSGTLGVSGVGQASIGATLATHWTLVTYSVKFTESGLATGTSWQLDVNGHSKVTTGKSLTFLIPNGTYAFTATSSGHPNVTGSVTVDGTSVTETVTFS